MDIYCKCKKNGLPVTETCHDTTCEWLLNQETYLNCTWVACDHGPFTLEEVGAMMGVTRERIRQIEAKALLKLNHRKRKALLDDFTDESQWSLN